MNEILKAIIVGTVQGLTEFLPVSSSGHIVIAQNLLGLTSSNEENLFFAILLHFATALSTIVFFRKDMKHLLDGVLKLKWNEETQFCVKIAISMIPAAFAGFILKDLMEHLFSDLRVVGFALIATACLLFLADRSKGTFKDITFRDSAIIGVSQAFAALLPGLSRSGTTIATSIMRGNDKTLATRFSFLMVLPLIVGASLKMLIEADTLSSGTGLQTQMSYGSLLAGFLSAFLFGLLACKWMMVLVKNAKLTYFSVYCLAVGTVVLCYTTLG
jgi:undecaprenyl-diphosphatase